MRILSMLLLATISICALGADSLEEEIFQIENDLNSKEPSVLDDQETPETPHRKALKNKQSYTAFYIGYIINPQVKFDGAYIESGVRESISGRYRFKNDFKFGAEWSQFVKHSWNHGGMIEYADLKFDNPVTIRVSGTTATMDTAGGVSLLTFAYSGKYRWDRSYLPVNVGWGHSRTYETDNFAETMSTRLYLSMGAGFVAADNVNIEMLASAYTTTAKEVKFGTGTIVPSDIGYLTSFQLNAKLLF